MKSAESPALTAECIWNSFRISGKRHLLLTGSPGSGKTALLSRLAPSLPGVTTWAEPGKGVYLRELRDVDTREDLSALEALT